MKKQRNPVQLNEKIAFSPRLFIVFLRWKSSLEIDERTQKKIILYPFAAAISGF